jgi:acetyl esterase/lipase
VPIATVPTVPIGYLVSVALIAFCTLFALTPVRRPWPISIMSYYGGLVLNELPFVAFYWLLASTLLAVGQGDIDSPVGWAAIGLAVLTTVGLVVVGWRGVRAGPQVQKAMNDGLGTGWRTSIHAAMAARLRRHLPWVLILLVPFSVRRRDVERVANISYGNAGKRNLLDVYRHRTRASSGPTLVYLHGGGYFSGRKNREARPLLYRLASQGWLCVSANYRLRPAASFPDHLIDVKRVIAWVREHGREYGADPGVLFLAGSSAGGHLTSLAALTPNEPGFQPGFEHEDTSFTAAISLYGYYGGYYGHADNEWPPSSPMAYDGTEAPPFFVAHGDLDPLVSVEDARLFAERLRSASSNPVVYAELPGALHAFDLFHSIRFETVVDAIEAFAAWVRSRGDAQSP